MHFLNSIRGVGRAYAAKPPAAVKAGNTIPPEINFDPHRQHAVSCGVRHKEQTVNDRKPIALPPEGGRQYDMGRIKARFKADGPETANRYSVSEWFLEPNTTGPGEHVHVDHDDMFYIIEGVMDIRVGGQWASYPRGSFVMAPAGTPHDFRNSSSNPAGLLNFSTDAGFEDNMPMIVEWFKDNPPQDVN